METETFYFIASVYDGGGAEYAGGDGVVEIIGGGGTF